MYKVFFNDRILYLTDDILSEDFSREEVLHLQNLDELQATVQNFSARVDLEILALYYPDIEQLFVRLISFFRFIEAAGGLVKNPLGEFLVIFRNGKWDLPKGKLDRGEKTEVAATREISEECGISGQKQIRFLTETYHTYEENHQQILKKSVWYEYFYDGEETPRPQIKEGITDVRWLKSWELKMVFENTYPSIADVFAAAGVYK
jgi:8-oxo-dGTP pyrophosphatase MutT (NUDIX family)